MKHTCWLPVALAALALAGCASTPEKRITKNPELFNSFPPEVQAKVRAGHIEMGFSPDMVTLALGRPHRVYSRVTEAGEVSIWAYTSARYDSNIQTVETMGWTPDRRGRLRPFTHRTWVDVGGWDEYDALRVEFREGKVTAIESLERP
jgi:hypothetical protein